MRGPKNRSLTRFATWIGVLTVAFAPPLFAETLQDVMKSRELSQQDVLAAAKTYVPTGGRDEFVVELVQR